MLLRTFPVNPLKKIERDAVKMYRDRGRPAKDYLKDYYTLQEHRVQLYEAMIATRIWPFSKDTVRDYRHRAWQNLYRGVVRSWLSRYVYAWAAIVLGCALMVGGLVSLFARTHVHPAVWLALGAAGIAYGAVQRWRRNFALERARVLELQWNRYSLSGYTGYVPDSFAATAATLGARAPQVQFEVEELGGGKYVFLMAQWLGQKYRFEEWHSGEL